MAKSNPNRKEIVDTRTPEELLNIIEQKSGEIQEALAMLRKAMKKDVINVVREGLSMSEIDEKFAAGHDIVFTDEKDMMGIIVPEGKNLPAKDDNDEEEVSATGGDEDKKRALMVNKTAAIIEMFTSEKPVCNFIKAREYKEMDNPFEAFRDWSEKYFNVTRTLISTTEPNDATSVSYFDPGIDIVKVNEFIKSLDTVN